MIYRKTTRLVLELVPFVLIIAIPVSVHADIFGSIASMIRHEVPEEVVYTNTHDAQNIPLLKAALHTDPNPAKGGGDIIVKNGSLVAEGGIYYGENTINTRTANGEISVYTVRPEGDTISQIAEMFDVSVNTILWANDISDADLIQPGDTLVILPITGIRHVVKKGDTINAIAKKYGGDMEEILSYNQFRSVDDVSIGDTIFIPGGESVAPKITARRVATPARTSGTAVGSGSSGFTHPLPGSIKTQGIHGYNAVDLAAGAGTLIRAAAAGEVIVSKNSGWNGGYGSYVVIKHPNGVQTLYAHTSGNAVSVGARVTAGQTIAYVGNTGRSTGNHLHFEVRGARNPF